jgi:xanthine dehydrogenase accessory factor
VVAEVIHEIRVGSLTVVAPAARHSPVIQAVDPVCGMAVTIGPSAEHVQLDGDDYWFCSAACRRSFAAPKGSV